MIYISPNITRADLRANPIKTFVFGDNVERRGFGGQAAEMRGEPNALGICTKWKPSTFPNSYFYDYQFDETRRIVDDDLNNLISILDLGFDIVIPAAPFGSGLSKLDKTSPLLYEYLNDRILRLMDLYND